VTEQVESVIQVETVLAVHSKKPEVPTKARHRDRDEGEGRAKKNKRCSKISHLQTS
jgi:hypothetical protein